MGTARHVIGVTRGQLNSPCLIGHVVACGVTAALLVSCCDRALTLVVRGHVSPALSNFFFVGLLVPHESGIWLEGCCWFPQSYTRFSSISLVLVPSVLSPAGVVL